MQRPQNSAEPEVLLVTGEWAAPGWEMGAEAEPEGSVVPQNT